MIKESLLWWMSNEPSEQATHHCVKEQHREHMCWETTVRVPPMLVRTLSNFCYSPKDKRARQTFLKLGSGCAAKDDNNEVSKIESMNWYRRSSALT